MNGIRYKIVIYGEKLSREIRLPDEKRKISVGTLPASDIRLHKADFEQDFHFDLVNEGGNWRIICSEDCCLDLGNGSKYILESELQHCASVTVIGTFCGKKIFQLLFMADFTFERKYYDCMIDLESSDHDFTIGNSPECNISFRDFCGHNYLLEVAYHDKELWISSAGSFYGVQLNGNEVHSDFKVSDTDFFSVIKFSFYYKDKKLYISDSKDILIQGMQWAKTQDSSSALEYPLFNRNSQIQIVIPNDPINVLPPAKKPEEPKENIVKTILPSVFMLFLIIFVRGFMSSGGGSYIIFSVCSMLIGIGTGVANYISGKKNYKKDIENRRNTYIEYIHKKEREIKEAREKELDLLNQKYPDSERNYQLMRQFLGRLFDREIGMEDFCVFRLGSGTIAPARTVVINEQEQIDALDELELLPRDLKDNYCFLDNAPICVDLKKEKNIGIVGPENARYLCLKNILLDLTVHHYYGDLKLFLFVNEEHRKNMQWLRFLPHVQNDETGMRNIAWDEETRTAGLEWLYKELCVREDSREKAAWRAIVIFVFDDMGLKTHPISRFFESSSKYNVYFIFFETHRERLPMYLGRILEMYDEVNGELQDTKSKENHTSIRQNIISDALIEEYAKRIAPIYCREVTLESTLTKNITLYQLLGIYKASELDLGNRWGKQDICETMAAPLGIKTKNQIVFLDLHERAHGPHGLVAGTTGSGKSEILQTYILSLSALYPPSEVGFVLIDFKGGGMANQFENLPHLLGAIRDIDGNEMNRSLLSIRAELDRRKSLFAQQKVDNIADYIRLYKTRKVTIPLPHLIIIVDEFAELKSEQPEFMKELVSAARIGRSLGVHLILATQKPAGQVSEQIWSNSRFKLCLKVQTREDSNEMLKSPLAADILEPGRAYLQVGNNEIFELFQSAYSGAKESFRDDDIQLREFHIDKVDFSGKRTVVYEQKNKFSSQDQKKQLQAIVDYIADFCREQSVFIPSAICLPSLPARLSFPDNYFASETTVSSAIGLYDAPSLQYQGIVRMELTGINTMVIGASGTGKTNLIQTMIRSLALNYTPSEVNLYLLDFNSGFLNNYRELPHVGGVICAADEEKYKNLFKMLNQQITLRKDKLVGAGVSSYSSYREAGFTDLPAVILFVDNYTALKETYLDEEDLLLPICRDGLSLGISVVIANSQTQGFGFKYYSVISNRIALHCNDHDDVNNLFGFSRREADNIPGRALVSIDKEIYDAQIYLAFEGDKEIERSKEIRKFVDSMKEKYPDTKAKSIPEIPETLTISEAYEFALTNACEKEFVIGLDYDSIESVSLPFENQFFLTVLAKDKRRKEIFLDNLMSDIQTYVWERKLQIYFVDNISRKYKAYEDFPCMKHYSSKSEDVLEILEQLDEELEARYELLETEGMERIEEKPLLLIVINNRRCLELLSGSKEHLGMLDKMIKDYRMLKALFLFTEVDNTAAGYGAPEVMKRLRDERKALIFDSLKDVKLFELPAADVRRKNKQLRRQDAFYVDGDEIKRIKLPKVEEEKKNAPAGKF